MYGSQEIEPICAYDVDPLYMETFNPALTKDVWEWLLEEIDNDDLNEFSADWVTENHWFDIIEDGDTRYCFSIDDDL